MDHRGRKLLALSTVLVCRGVGVTLLESTKGVNGLGYDIVANHEMVTHYYIFWSPGIQTIPRKTIPDYDVEIVSDAIDEI